MIIEPIIQLLILLVSLGLTVAITVPLSGVLVRFRVNYTPKRLQLDTEGNIEPTTGAHHASDIPALYLIL